MPEIKTILVLAQHPELAESIRAALAADRYRIVHRVDFTDAEPLLEHGLIHVCAVDASVVETQGMWIFDRIHRRMPSAPILVFSDDPKWALEEEAYSAGVKHVLIKPVRPR